MAVKIQVEVFEDGGSEGLRNFYILTHRCAPSEPRRTWFEAIV